MQRASPHGKEAHTMIRELRTRHRRIVILLAIALPALVAIALTARRAIPVMDRLPAAPISNFKSHISNP